MRSKTFIVLAAFVSIAISTYAAEPPPKLLPGEALTLGTRTPARITGTFVHDKVTVGFDSVREGTNVHLTLRDVEGRPIYDAQSDGKTYRLDFRGKPRISRVAIPLARFGGRGNSRYDASRLALSARPRLIQRAAEQDQRPGGDRSRGRASAMSRPAKRSLQERLLRDVRAGLHLLEVGVRRLLHARRLSHARRHMPAMRLWILFAPWRLCALLHGDLVPWRASVYGHQPLPDSAELLM